MLPAPKIAALLEPGFVEARLHTDPPDAEKGDANRKRQMQMVGYVAAPFYVVVDPKTQALDPAATAAERGRRA